MLYKFNSLKCVVGVSCCSVQYDSVIRVKGFSFVYSYRQLNVISLHDMKMTYNTSSV